MKVQIEQRWYAVEMDDIRTNPVRVLVDGVPVEIEVEGLPAGEIPGPSAASGVLAGTPRWKVTEVRAPMLGVMISVAVSVGQQVSAGEQLCVMEALKLQQSIRAPAAGVVRAVRVQPGQSVTAGQVLLELR
jgi:biotin carboxyl carrier protein